MDDIKKKADRGSIRMHYNIGKSSQDSNSIDIAGSEWYFKAEKRIREPQAAANMRDMRAEIFADPLDMPAMLNLDVRFDGARARSVKYFLVNIFCKRASSEVPLTFDYEICLNGSKNDLVVKGTHCFEVAELVVNCPVEAFLPWNQLLHLNNGFMDRSNVIIVSVDIRVRDSVAQRNAKNLDLFSSPSKFPAADCVLVIGGEHVHASKAYLAIHSKVFKEMFESENQKEYELTELIHFDFMELLAVIYPSYSPITDENVENLLRLAKRFEMISVINQCETFLKFDSGLPLGRKLVLAQSYCLVDLKHACAELCLCAADVKNMGEDYALLDPDTKCLLLKSLLKADKKPTTA